LKVDDAHFLERMTKGTNDISDQVVRQRPRGLHTLLLKRNGRGLGLADPDRQIAVAVGFPKQQDGLILGLLHADADHTNLTHLCPPLAPVTLQNLSLILSDQVRRAPPT
jgi:hypothetical protein